MPGTSQAQLSTHSGRSDDPVGNTESSEDNLGQGKPAFSRWTCYKCVLNSKCPGEAQQLQVSLTKSETWQARLWTPVFRNRSGHTPFPSIHWACSPLSYFALRVLSLPLSSPEPSGTVWCADVLALPVLHSSASSSKDTVSTNLPKRQTVLRRERYFARRFELFGYKPWSPNNRLTGPRKEVELD